MFVWSEAIVPQHLNANILVVQLQNLTKNVTFIMVKMIGAGLPLNFSVATPLLCTA